MIGQGTGRLTGEMLTDVKKDGFKIICNKMGRLTIV
jgi:hypothetical protein